MDNLVCVYILCVVGQSFNLDFSLQGSEFKFTFLFFFGGGVLSGFSCPFFFALVQPNVKLLLLLQKMYNKIENYYFSLIAAPIEFGMF